MKGSVWAILGAGALAGVAVAIWRYGLQAGIGVAILILAIIAMIAAVVVWIDRGMTRLIESHPVLSAALFGVFVIPSVGVVFAVTLPSLDVHLEQGVDQFSVLAQVLVALLIAFSIELTAVARGQHLPAPARQTQRVFMGGTGFGGVVALAASLAGVVHPWPGLLFLCVGIGGALMLATAVVTGIPMRLWPADNASGTALPSQSGGRA